MKKTDKTEKRPTEPERKEPDHGPLSSSPFSIRSNIRAGWSSGSGDEPHGSGWVDRYD